MIIAQWIGKAIPDNKRLIWTKTRMVPNSAYKAFKEDLAWTIKAAANKQRFGKKRVDLKVRTNVNKRMDKQNLWKPICDALELSGVIDNDKQIRNLSMIEEGQKKQGENDELWIVVNEVVE